MFESPKRTRRTLQESEGEMTETLTDARSNSIHGSEKQFKIIYRGKYVVLVSGNLQKHACSSMAYSAANDHQRIKGPLIGKFEQTVATLLFSLDT